MLYAAAETGDQSGALSPMLRVLVVEDQPIVIAGVRAIFADDNNIVLSDARTATAGRAAYLETKPDVIVIDINLPDGSGLALAREVTTANKDARVVVYSMSDAAVLALQAIDLGAKGYVSKNGDPDCLRQAVYAVSRGQTWFPEDLIQEMALLRTGFAGALPTLTEREIQMLRLLVRGRSLSEIAVDLSVSYKTAAALCAGMRTKFNARTNSEMVRIAVELRVT